MRKAETQMLGQRTLLLVGAGRMGLAMLRGWLNNPLSCDEIVAVEPSPSTDLLDLAQRHSRLKVQQRLIGDLKPDVVVLAVKPQAARTALDDISPLIAPNTLVISILAGVTIGALQHALPGTSVVRAMPNLGVAVGKGMVVAVAATAATRDQLEMASELLGCCGDFAWLDSENLIDGATAVSGSGPAYGFLLAEALEEAAVRQGLNRAVATRLARMTLIGTGALLAEGQASASELRRMVTSPNGTTAAGLSVLQEGDAYSRLVGEAVNAASERARQMSSLLEQRTET